MFICLWIFKNVWLFKEFTFDRYKYSIESKGGTPIIPDPFKITPLDNKINTLPELTPALCKDTKNVINMLYSILVKYLSKIK